MILLFWESMLQQQQKQRSWTNKHYRIHGISLIIERSVTTYPLERSNECLSIQKSMFMLEKIIFLFVF